MRARVCIVVTAIISVLFLVRTDGQASEPKPSVTPLADTGLWKPPVLTSDQYQFIPIPEAQGLAAFYGRYRPMGSNDIGLLDGLTISSGEVITYGNPSTSVIDDTMEYRLLHQGPNYVFLKFRQFPIRPNDDLKPGESPRYKKDVGFMILGFIEKKTRHLRPYILRISRCEGTRLPLFEPDTYNQSPEADAKELANSRIDKEMRETVSRGAIACGSTASFAIDERSD